jgi:very-short-patch-repair endonuclease
VKKEQYSYNPKLKEYARELRNNPTFAEKSIWYSLRGKQVMGYDFDRQKPIGEFIFDFFCSELKLVIEIDGISHEEDQVKQNDKNKDEFAKSKGFNVLRFTDGEVLGRGDYVMNKIKEYIQGYESLLDSSNDCHTP